MTTSHANTRIRVVPQRIASCLLGTAWCYGLHHCDSPLLQIFIMMRSMDALSTLSSDDLADYDIISDGIRSLESSVADIGSPNKALTSGAVSASEPPPSQKAETTFGTPAFSPENIQSYVERALGSSGGTGTVRGNAVIKPVRVYVDGPFDGFNVASVYYSCFETADSSMLTRFVDMHYN